MGRPLPAARGFRPIIVRPWLNAACVVALLAVTHAPVAVGSPSNADCDRARALPAGADAESRRITCEIPAEFQEDVSLAQFFGREMRLHDIAAWLTTDALKDAGAFNEMPGPGQGWLTREYDDRVEVRYFSEHDFDLLAFAQADLDIASAKAVRPRRLQPPQPPTTEERARLLARNLAVSREALRCSKSINTIVLRFDRGSRTEIRVYVISAWSGGQLVFGGHSLYTVSADGKAMLSEYSHTRGCLLFDPPAENQVGLVVTHLSTPTPDEFHVFLSLQHQLPIRVVTTTNGLIWEVKEGSIRLLVPSKEIPDSPGKDP